MKKTLERGRSRRRRTRKHQLNGTLAIRALTAAFSLAGILCLVWAYMYLR